MQKFFFDRLGSEKSNKNQGLKKPNSTHWCPIHLTNAGYEFQKEIEKDVGGILVGAEKKSTQKVSIKTRYAAI